MPPDDRRDRANSRLNQAAVGEVKQQQRQTVSPAPAEADAVDLAFESEAYRYAAEWLATHKANAAKANPFALILSRSITLDEKLLRAAKVENFVHYHAFLNQKLIDVQGCLLLVTMNLEHAISVPLDAVAKTQQLFNEIESLGLGGRHIAAFEPPAAHLILLRRGLNETTRGLAVVESGHTQPWALDQLENEILQFHQDHTATPSGVLVPWYKANLGITGEQLELRISKALAHQLDLKWKRGSVLAEAGTPSGRMDIFIGAQVLKNNCGPCVVEVKVLRTRGRNRKMPATHAERWAKKGVVQATLYRRDKGAPTAYLCSFDAREKNVDIPAVDAFAGERDVKHKRYFMHRSAGGLQDEDLSKASG